MKNLFISIFFCIFEQKKKRNTLILKRAIKKQQALAKNNSFKINNDVQKN